MKKFCMFLMKAKAYAITSVLYDTDNYFMAKTESVCLEDVTFE